MKGHVAILAWSILAGSAANAAEPNDLEDLVRKQTALIEQLQDRVAALEAQQGTKPHQKARAADAPPPNTNPAVLAANASPSSPSPRVVPRIAAASEAGPVGSVSWSNGGPTFVGPSGATFHVRGRLWLDASNTSGSRDPTRNLSGTEVRSFRLGADGLWGDHIAYKAEVDLADSAVSIKDLYIGWLGKLGGNDLEVYAGNKLGDRGIEGATPDETMPFQERNEVASGIGPEKGIFGMGLLAKLIGKNWSGSVNIVGDDANNNVGTTSDSITYIGRFQWTPKLADRVLLHIGGSGYYEDLSRGARTLNRSAYDTGHFNDNVRISETPIVDATHTIGEQAEAGAIVGPFWTMGEYGRRVVDTLSGTKRHQDALAISGGLFLTGEDTNFLGRTGTWVRVRPRHPLNEGGLGAFEIVSRYEELDLGPADLAGSGNAFTLGMDWYPNPFSRVMLSYVRWHVVNPTGSYVGSDSGNSVNLRLQAAF